MARLDDLEARNFELEERIATLEALVVTHAARIDQLERHVHVQGYLGPHPVGTEGPTDPDDALPSTAKPRP